MYTSFSKKKKNEYLQARKFSLYKNSDLLNENEKKEYIDVCRLKPNFDLLII